MDEGDVVCENVDLVRYNVYSGAIPFPTASLPEVSFMDRLEPKWGKAVIQLAIPNGPGHWHVLAAEAEIVDGAFHKLTFPGFETRSGEGFGITATIHSVSDVFQEGGQLLGTVRRLILQNGRVHSSDVVGERERILLLGSGGGDDKSGLQPPAVAPN